MSSACSHREVRSVTPTGTYELVEVDGKALPALISHGPAEVRVAAGSLTFGPDDSCLSYTRFGLPTGDPIDRNVRATYSQTGNDLLLRWERAGTTAGTLTENGFTMINEGTPFTYRKQTAASASASRP